MVLGSLANLHAGEPLPKWQLDRLADGLTASPRWPASASQVLCALEQPARPGNARFTVEKSRGQAIKLYPQVAPAVVIVRTSDGMGTGWIVDADGWIITNHHVIADAELDEATGAPEAKVFLGTLREGFMHFDESNQGLPALVYKSSSTQDLALLKIDRPTRGSLPYISLATRVPVPGSDCIAIGHPAAGVLWSVREGTVSGVGRWPGDFVDEVMQRLGADNDERKRLETELAHTPQMQVVVSTCGINSGDSGGPLVDDQGKVFAVSFAKPSDPTRDKFAYHIHLDEVRQFLAKRPAKPTVTPPDAWPPAAYHVPADVDDDGQLDTIVAMVNVDGKPRPTGLLIDLDQDSALPTEIKELSADELHAKWDFEFAQQFAPVSSSSYDTNGDGLLDLIVQRAGEGDTVRVWKADKRGQWAIESGKEVALYDPERIKNDEQRKRLLVIVGRLTEESK
jgi:S1-C subfamily serine protease